MKEKVVDFIKKKGSSLTLPPFAIRDHIPPALLDHWSEFRAMANNTQVANWIREQQILSQTRKPEPPKPIILPEKAQQLLCELSEQLGEIIHTGPWLTVDQAQINQFAQVTGDKQWIHTDPQRAALESPFKTTIAHGFLTLSLLSTLTESVDPDNPRYPQARMAVNYGLNQVRFPYPVKQGSTLRAHTKLVSVQPISRGLELVEEVTVQIEGTRRPACVAEMVLRLYF